MKVCCFVNQEHEKVPSGVVTVICAVLSHWPSGSDKKMMILCNKDHWASYRFQELLHHQHIECLIRYPIQSGTRSGQRISDSIKNATMRKLFQAIMPLVQTLCFLSEVFRLKRLLLKHEVDVVFSHNGGYPGGYLNRIAVVGARLAGIRKNYMIIHNLPSPIPPKEKWVTRIVDRLVASSVSKFFSVSRSCADALREERFPWTTFGVIPNGISTDPSPKKMSHQKILSWKTNVPVIAFSGELHPRKGLDVLVESLAKLQGEFNVILYGNGEENYTDHLKQKVDRLGLTPCIRFEGYCEDAADKLRDCDLLVLPSVAYESFGMVLLEAMYWQKAVICSDIGGMKEIVQHEKTGLVVPAGDVEALREALQYMLDHPDKSKQWGINGYEHLKKCFDIRRTVEIYHQLS